MKRIILKRRLTKKEAEKYKLIRQEIAIERLVETLRKLLTYAENNTCLHEETFRGGCIWEICSHCGKKWADDKGGKPADAHHWPEEIKYAQTVLKAWK